jgi:6-phosphofructokinase 1
MKRIAILTSGGDAPGMNAAIRAAVRTAAEQNIEVMGVRCGFTGLVAGDFIPLGPRDVGGIIELGGTILESARCPEFCETAVRARALDQLAAHGVDGLIIIGGSGTQQGAHALSLAGARVNGVASTIDNDLCGSDMTIGVDTAVNTALEAIDRLRTTARSHRRVFIVETMGRESGYLALAAGIAGGAEVIVTPENDLPAHVVRDLILEAKRRGKQHAIVVVAEGAKNDAHTLYSALCASQSPELQPRLTILGHMQRGGRPTAFDRVLATRLAARATTLLLDGKTGLLVGLLCGSATATALGEIAGVEKTLPRELLELVDKMKL